MRSQSFVPNSFIVIVADINVLTLCQPEKRKKGREGASKEGSKGGREREHWQLWSVEEGEKKSSGRG